MVLAILIWFITSTWSLSGSLVFLKHSNMQEMFSRRVARCLTVLSRAEIPCHSRNKLHVWSAYIKPAFKMHFYFMGEILRTSWVNNNTLYTQKSALTF
jgi:hypothetical protein